MVRQFPNDFQAREICAIFQFLIILLYNVNGRSNFYLCFSSFFPERF